ncbi:MAG: hypothetical protein QOG69_1069, partial [Actinomycetota bacterium]|nr:hypothetical protein [Actinomycetota bacterium]
RAREVRPDFALTAENGPVVAAICRRLDGLPLAIELAAARVRALSLTEIVDSLHDRFRLLTGGSRIAVRRQQTLRASVDWSHALLTDTERILFRRLAVFLGGFDLSAAQFVCGGSDVEHYQVLDQLTLLVDKSLVVADDSGRTTRYRLLETVRQYALEKLGESGEPDKVRSRHRDHYTSMAAVLDAPAGSDYEQRLEQADVEMDNLRSAFGWSLENLDVEQALALASSLQPLWFSRGRMREGRAWMDLALKDADSRAVGVAAAMRARALADKAVLDCWVGTSTDRGMDQAQQALAMARELDDDALLARTLTTCGFVAGQRYDVSAARTYFTEAIGLARASDDRWRLSQILTWQADAAIMTGDPIVARLAVEEGLQVAEAIGDRPNARGCRFYLGYVQLMQAEVSSAVAQFRDVAAESEAAHDSLIEVASLMGLGNALVYQGEVSAARAMGHATLDAGADIDDYFSGLGYSVLAQAGLAEGDIPAAQVANEAAWRCLSNNPQMASAALGFNGSAVALAAGDLAAARRLADEAVSIATGWHLVVALTTRARVRFADGRREEAVRDARDALACAAECGAYLPVPDTFECLAGLCADADGHIEAARLFGAADGLRQRAGVARFQIYQASYDGSVAALRTAMDEQDFDAAWAEGFAMSIAEAIAYAQRGRGERKRPSTGWASLTPAEADVVRLVAEGFTNKDVAARLFISPRTVQAHLAHVFAKLGVTSRTQLAQEAARRG